MRALRMSEPYVFTNFAVSSQTASTLSASTDDSRMVLLCSSHWSRYSSTISPTISIRSSSLKRPPFQSSDARTTHSSVLRSAMRKSRSNSVTAIPRGRELRSIRCAVRSKCHVSRSRPSCGRCASKNFTSICIERAVSICFGSPPCSSGT